MRKLTSAYLAGIIDSDGYVSLLKVKKGKKKYWSSSRNYLYVPVVKVAMVERDFILWLKQSFGGTFETRKAHGNARESYCWSIKQTSAIEFLQKIYPHMRIKDKQAKLLFRFKNLNNGAGKPISDENWNKRDSIYLEMRKLTSRGAV